MKVKNGALPPPFNPGDVVYFDYDHDRSEPVTVVECKSAHARYTDVVTPEWSGQRRPDVGCRTRNAFLLSVRSE